MGTHRRIHVAESTLPPIFTKLFLQSTVHTWLPGNFTDIYFHFSLDTVTLRNTILEPCTFPLQWTWKVSLQPKLILNLKPLESLHLVLPLQTRPLLIKLLYSIKMIRHLPCAKALSTRLRSSVVSDVHHLPPTPPVPAVTMSTFSPGADGQLYIFWIKSTNRWGQKKGNIVQWAPMTVDEIESWDSPVFVMLPDFTLVTWG